MLLMCCKNDVNKKVRSQLKVLKVKEKQQTVQEGCYAESKRYIDQRKRKISTKNVSTYLLKRYSLDFKSGFFAENLFFFL